SEVALGGGRAVPVDRIGPGWLTCSVNLAGLPGLNVPAGHSSEGMPIGVTLVGPAGGETKLLRLASLWAARSGGSGARPPRPPGAGALGFGGSANEKPSGVH